MLQINFIGQFTLIIMEVVMTITIIKLTWWACPKVRSIYIIYPLKFANMYMVTDKTSLLTFDNATF